ncbi:MAG: DUF3021 domain-containing protein [Lachnospiraceae bacterium]|nr:DUF3021 domain-containing protein [Lachnospiraceae bacterium]
MLITTLKRGGVGFLLGMAVGNIIAFITAYAYSAVGYSRFVSPGLIERCGSEAVAFLIQTILSGLIGCAGWAGMSFFEIERWSMLQALLAHLAVIYAVYFPCAFFLFWVTSFQEFLLMAGIMFAADMVIWRIMCTVYQAQVRELNLMQERLAAKRI